MSWFFGLHTFNNPLPEVNLASFHNEPLYSFSAVNFYIAAGGTPETCHFNNDAGKGLVAAGLGIKLDVSLSKLFLKDDWIKILSGASKNRLLLDGHFAVIKWNNNEVEFFTDQTGLRSVYFCRYKNGICFSTRLDWAANLTGSNVINPAVLGQRWILFNQIGYDSPVTGIERTGPSAHIIFKNGELVKKEHTPFNPEFNDTDGSEAKNILLSLAGISTYKDRKLSLSLSGGFDSRTLLALHIANGKKNFSVHTFGESEEPDVAVASKISKELHLNFRHFHNAIPEDIEGLFILSKSYAAQGMLTEPVSSVVRLQYYNHLNKLGYFAVDGGFGEVARRQFLNKLYRLGKNSLFSKNIPAIFDLLRTRRADIFNADYTKYISYEAEKNLNDMFALYPDVREIGLENFIDLFSIIARVPNYAGPEQARSDSFILNYMPFLQPSFLKAVFKTKIASRNNGWLYKNIISEYAPELKKFPLVKGVYTYPYGLSSAAAWAYTKIKSKFIPKYVNMTSPAYFQAMKNYIFDIINSAEFKSWEGYDHKLIIKNIEEYYNGNTGLERYVDWWFTFELWKRSLTS